MDPLLRYPLDPTGKNPDNLVHGEIHNLTDRTVRAIAPTYGAFFTEGLVVVDNITQIELTKGLQYVTVDLVATASELYGKEICSVILITDTNVSSSVMITYQALGGMYAKNFEGVVNYLNTLAMDHRPATWPQILNRPKEFLPAKHLHDIGDIYGFEYITYALERIRNAILMTNDPVIDQLFQFIRDADNSNEDLINIVSENLSYHILNINNPHQTTKSQVGLGLVENMPLSNEIEIEKLAASANDVLPGVLFPVNKYVTLRTLTVFKNLIVSKIHEILMTHVNNKSNPHETTKSQVGLGLVENRPIVTDVEISQNLPVGSYVTFDKLQSFSDKYLTYYNKRTIDLTKLSTDYFFPVWWDDTVNTLDKDGIPNTVNISRNFNDDWELNPLNIYYTSGQGAGSIDEHQAGLSFSVETNGSMWSGASVNLFDIKVLNQVYDETMRIPRYAMKCYFKNEGRVGYPSYEGYINNKIIGSPSKSGCYLRGGFTYKFTSTSKHTALSMRYSRSYDEVELAYVIHGPGYVMLPHQTPADYSEFGMFTKAFNRYDSFLERPIVVRGARPNVLPGRPAQFEDIYGLVNYANYNLYLGGDQNPFP